MPRWSMTRRRGYAPIDRFNPGAARLSSSVMFTAPNKLVLAMALIVDERGRKVSERVIIASCHASRVVFR